MLIAVPCWAAEFDFRLKWFATRSALPSHDIQRPVTSTPTTEQSFDLRTLWRHTSGQFRWLVDHSAVVLQGDALALGRQPGSMVEQPVTSDMRRAWDLTWEINEGARHASFHRLDRLALQWQPGNWSITVGRQAVSWGSGIVFQPLDLFSPFAPTVVDRDYKAGDDLVLIDRLLSNGHDLQMLHIVRRDLRGERAARVGSTAVKWHGAVGALELEGVAAKHFDAPVVGGSLRMPLGLAMLRADVVATRAAQERAGQEQWRVSGILNTDISFTIGERNAYAFAEYFHNDWGVERLPLNIADLPSALQDRLARGEVFNLMRDYMALGGSFEWHPLVNHSVTLITNLHDSSSLLQMQINYEPSDRQRVQLGWLQPLGGRGDEFGGVPVVPSPLQPTQALTTGGATRIYVRWSLYL